MHTIAILTWWESDERVISLQSAQAVDDALSERWYSVTQYLLPEQTKEFVSDSGQYDFARVMIHGQWWEDGQVAWLLDMLDIPYQCTGRDVLWLTMDKRLTKQVWKQTGLPVARDVMLDVGMDREEIRDMLSGFDFRCVCKALDQGSSQGVLIVSSSDQLDDVISLVQHYGRVMCEDFVEWDECTVAILGDEAFPVVEIVPPEWGEFDFENKYNGQTVEICPARYDDVLTRQVQAVALDAYRAVWCTQYGRVDIMIGEQWPVLLEINTIPWFTSQSLFPLAAKTVGMSFGELCERLMS